MQQPHFYLKLFIIPRKNTHKLNMARNLLLEKQRGAFNSNVYVLFIGALVTLLLISSFLIFSCAQGAENKDKDDTAGDSNMYGAGCGAACGGACGG
ncbi:hypothetical protein LIER_33813 [Lithospermum erythrorhizon]|uniref:Transmembrane protein n=1 Tax=Lithospermum erythrorhizon TaxID=34254 RepID=A0AAV3PJ33_LITER